MAFTDSFDRANSGDLGSAWDAGYTGWSAAQIVSNKVRVTALGDPETAESYNATTPGADQFAQVTLTLNSAAPADSIGGVLLRAAAPATVTFYWCAACVFTGNNQTIVRKRVAGVETEILFLETRGWTSGDILTATAVGTLISILRNGTLEGSVVDASIATGRVGLYLYQNAANAVSDMELNDFVGGDITDLAARRAIAGMSPAVHRASYW